MENQNLTESRAEDTMKMGRRYSVSVQQSVRSRSKCRNPNKKLHALLVSEEVISEKGSWLTDVPNRVRQGGVIQLGNAHITILPRKKNKNHHFMINFQERKH